MKRFLSVPWMLSAALGLAFLLMGASVLVSTGLISRADASDLLQAPIVPQGDRLEPEKREAIFWDIIEQTLRQMPKDRQKDLLMVGTGSWMSTEKEKRQGANDIDATIAYVNGDVEAAQEFQCKFYDNLGNLQRSGRAPLPDITLFVDEQERGGRCSSPGKQDFYRGPTGNYFFYEHSRNNNPNSAFDLALDEGGKLRRPDGKRPASTAVEEFWTRRGKDLPTKIAQADLFVEDNQSFLEDKYKQESDLVKLALTIGKYVDRVEADLKEVILRQWDKELPVREDLGAMVEKVECLRRFYYMLELAAPPSEERRRVMDCLGAQNDNDMQRLVVEFYNQAKDYFQFTLPQVRDAERSQPQSETSQPSWIGTWKRPESTFTITGQGYPFTVVEKGSNTSVNSWTSTYHLTLKGSKASGDYSGDYKDPDKTITMKGTAEFTMQDSDHLNVHIKCTSATDTWTKPVDQKKPPYTPAVHAGAEWDFGLTRVR